MTYQKPELHTPEQRYESPMLLDLAEISAVADLDVEIGSCNGCGTGGCSA